MNEIYKSVIQTDHVVSQPAKRSDFCSLKNSIDVNINGKFFCLAHVGQKKHRDALQLCQSLNATLPLPRSLKEHSHFIESFKRLRMGKKMADISTKIVLDVRRLPKKGRAIKSSSDYRL